MNRTITEDMPDYRWEMASLLLKHNRRPSRNGDDKLRRAFHYLQRYTHDDAGQRLTLRRDYPDLYWAHALFEDPRSERWMIEAGLLTDRSFGDLGDYVGKPAKVIETYADMYYDVRDKLKSRGYILNRVLMPAYDKGIHGRDYDLTFKTLAYCFGWDVFAEFVDSGILSDTTRTALLVSFKDRLLKLGWMSAHQVEINQYNALDIMEKTVRLIEIDAEASRHGGAGYRGEVMSLLQGLLDKCVTTMLPTRSRPDTDEPRLLGGALPLKYGDPIKLEKADGKAE